MNDYEDFLFIKSSTLTDKCCAYCGEVINLMPFIVGGEEFCDAFCAKLYADQHNKSIDSYNWKEYNTYYKNNLLSTQASIIYDALRKVDIKLLPKSNCIDKDPKINKVNYTNIILNYINHVL